MNGADQARGHVRRRQRLAVVYGRGHSFVVALVFIFKRHEALVHAAQRL
jgi:hypothetical protein